MVVTKVSTPTAFRIYLIERLLRTIDDNVKLGNRRIVAMGDHDEHIRNDVAKKIAESGWTVSWVQTESYWVIELDFPVPNSEPIE
jgi:predicted phosphatase